MFEAKIVVYMSSSFTSPFKFLWLIGVFGLKSLREVWDIGLLVPFMHWNFLLFWICLMCVNKL